jgi:hypothetical protein
MSESYGTAEIYTNSSPIIYANSATGNFSHLAFKRDKIISNPIYM